MRVTADSMLGRLARYLRLFGVDATYFNAIEDREIIDHALATKRLLLTRDTSLIRRKEVAGQQVDAVLIESDHVKAQLLQCFYEFDRRGFNLKIGSVHPRCVYCNKPLESAGKREAFGLVPAHIGSSTSDYLKCPKCGRIFWKGSHQSHFFKMIEELTCRKA